MNELMNNNQSILSEYSDQILEFRKTLSPEFQDQELMPDDILFRALISRDFKFEYANPLVNNYMKARKDYPNMFVSALDPKLERIFGQVHTFLPDHVKTRDGQRIFYTRGIDWNPDKYSMEDVCSSIILTLELKSLDYLLQKDGFIQMVDAKDIGWKHVKAFNPKAIQASGQLLVWYLPINLKYVLVFNTNWAVDFLWKMIRPLLPKELVERVIMCGKSVEKLSEYIPKEIIEQKAFVPSDDMRKFYAEDICSNDHLVQSFWEKHMKIH